MKRLALSLLAVVSIAGATEICVPPGRIEFATIPEIALVSGVPETIQLGPFMLDPANRWEAGDQTRESGWESRFPAILTAAPAGVTLDEKTLELRYDGTKGRQSSSSMIVANGKDSNTFRIRVVVPTNVYGDSAAVANLVNGWNATVCAGTFVACRQSFKGGAIDENPTVLFVTGGSYTGDFYLGKRKHIYVIGDPADPPTLTNDELSVQEPTNYVVRNLRLVDASITTSHAPKDSSSTMNVGNVDQCCESGEQNGLSNPNHATPYEWDVFWWNSITSGMGGTGNTTHASYVEGRPLSRFEVTNVRFLGTRGSSAVKSTMSHIAIRHSLFCVNASCSVPDADEKTMHTPIDVPAVSDVVVYANRFVLWRAPTSQPANYGGIKTGAIYFRLRNSLYGSDVPAYPDVTWSPPATSITTATSPGFGWSAGPETFVSDEFWTAVRADRRKYSFVKYVGFNTFVLLPGGKPVEALRDDGTYPMTVTKQFGPQVAQRTHPLAIERSGTELYDNTFEGYPEDATLYEMTAQQTVAVIKPGAKWPRTTPEEFPWYLVLDNHGPLPSDFRL